MKKYICWLDLETTGLDPYQDDIIEIGMALTEYEFPFSMLGTYHTPIWGKYGNFQFLEMNEVVKEMHEKTGLMQRLAAPSAEDWTPNGPLKTASYVARETSSWMARTLRQHAGDEEIRIHLGDSGVSRFDEQFLRWHMIELAENFHYRTIDVSPVREFLGAGGLPTTTPQLDEEGTIAIGLSDDERVKHRALWDALAARHEAIHLLTRLRDNA